jgi:hypothetical protein
MNKQDIGETAQQIIDDIIRLRDQGRVRLSLLGMELRDRWHELDKQVDDAVRTAREVSDVTVERARALREKLRSELQKHQ